MLKPFIIFLIFSVSLSGCEKIDVRGVPDSNYPTVIYKLSPSSYSETRTLYFQNNKYVQSSLNRFGFCGHDTNIRVVDSPPASNPQTQSEAIEIARNFISTNRIFTGVENPEDLTFIQADYSSEYWDGATYWHIKTANQRIDTIEILYTQILINIKYKTAYYCVGNWFPDIYIPKKFNISQDQAKAGLSGKVVSHFTIAGQRYEVKISGSDLRASSVNLVVLPVTNDDRIELRVTWQINIPGPVYYKIYVDVMTGEIVGEEPTITS